MKYPKTSEIINVDLDGVIYPFDQVLARWLENNGRYGPKNKNPFTKYVPGTSSWDQGCSYPEPEEWNYWEQWRLTKGEWYNQFRTAVEYDFMWQEGVPFPGAVDGMWKLSDAGFYVRIVTTRLVHKFGHRKAITATASWLDKFAVPYRSICFLGAEGKQRFEADALVDDNSNNVRRFAKKHGKAILMDQKYNQDVEDDEPHILRAFNWNDVVEALI